MFRSARTRLLFGALLATLAGCSTYRDIPRREPGADPRGGAALEVRTLAPGNTVLLRLRQGCSLLGRVTGVDSDTLRVAPLRLSDESEFGDAGQWRPCDLAAGDGVVAVAASDVVSARRREFSEAHTALLSIGLVLCGFGVVWLSGWGNMSGD